MLSLRSLVQQLSFRPDWPAGEANAGVELRRFLERYPAYQSTFALDRLWAREYSRLDRLGHVYLDYTGGGLYAESLPRDHLELLDRGVFGNPHSKNLTSLTMTELVERARARVLRFFNAAPDEYLAIFTPNASGALRLVGEAYPFGTGDTYLLTADNHNSVNGIREFARARGAQVNYLLLVAPELRADSKAVGAALHRPSQGVTPSSLTPREILLDDARRFAIAISAAGVAVTLEVWPGMTHGWHTVSGWLPETRTANNKEQPQ